MLEPIVIRILAVLGFAVLLLIIRLFIRRKAVRLGLALVPGSILCFIALLFVATAYPGPLGWILPYEHLGTYSFRDLDGNSCTATVGEKHLSNIVPPGVHPRLRLTAQSPRGTDTMTYDTGWRFGVVDVRPADGGIDVLTGLGCCSSGLRFHFRNGRWNPAPLGVQGLDGPPIDDLLGSQMTEDLRPLAAAIHRSPSIGSTRFNPVALVRAANLLQAAGRDRAAGALAAYQKFALKSMQDGRLQNEFRFLRCEDHQLDEGRVVPLIALLFPEAAIPPGTIQLVDDLPVRLSSPKVDLNDLLAALPKSPRFLDRALAPHAPLETIDGWLQIVGRSGSSGTDVRRQARIAAHNVLPSDRYLDDAPSPQEWDQALRTVRPLWMKWGAAAQNFVRSRP
jgi:hypothetical protein